MANITFFTGTIDPETNDLYMQRIECKMRENAAPLRIDVKHYDGYDPANADPTLTVFYEPRDEREDTDRAT